MLGLVGASQPDNDCLHQEKVILRYKKIPVPASKSLLQNPIPGHKTPVSLLRTFLNLPDLDIHFALLIPPCTGIVLLQHGTCDEPRTHASRHFLHRLAFLLFWHWNVGALLLLAYPDSGVDVPWAKVTPRIYAKRPHSLFNVAPLPVLLYEAHTMVITPLRRGSSPHEVTAPPPHPLPLEPQWTTHTYLVTS